MVMEGIQEDIGEGNIQCMNHPYKNSSPGGICALCLQEKLGKLVSSSFSSSIFPSSSSSSVSTPSVRSDFVATSTTVSLPTNNKNTNDCNNNNYHPYDTMRKSRMHFLLKKNKKKESSSSSSTDSAIVFKRSKSTTTPRNHLHFLETDGNTEAYGPHRKGFWSFLHYSSSKHYSSSSGSVRSREKKKEEFVVLEEENETSPNDQETAFDGKVARSRSVGCGSRSFSGDLFEKISTGLGDCTLRRVESQREGKPRFSSSVVHHHHKDRVNCGGIFSGFMITSSEENVNGKSKSWGWALASPMRAFSKTTTTTTTTTSSSSKREDSNKTTPNLAAIPSLLTISS